jgi:hypothetical protein
MIPRFLGQHGVALTGGIGRLWLPQSFSQSAFVIGKSANIPQRTNRGTIMLDITVTPEVADAIAEIGKHQMLGDLLDANGKFVLFKPKHPNYDSPEGKLFRMALAMIELETNWCGVGGVDGNRRCQAAALEESNKRLGYPRYVHRNYYDAVRGAVCKASGIPNDYHWVVWNDDHTHAEVIAKWHEAGHANGWL